jgi:hypothetical protein
MSYTELDALSHQRTAPVAGALRWLNVNPNLPAEQARVSELFERLAVDLLRAVTRDDPELTRALVLLTQAKDAAVRASIADAE